MTLSLFFFCPPPHFTPLSSPWREKMGLWRDKIIVRERHQKKSVIPPYLAVQWRGEPLSSRKVWKRECAHTLTSTIMRRSLTFTHTFTLAHGPTRSQAHAHNGEEGWLSSESTLQAAACLGKPDVFLPPGRSTHCHLKGSLLGPIHPRLCGWVLIRVPVPAPGDERVSVQWMDKAMKKKSSIQEERNITAPCSSFHPPPFSLLLLLRLAVFLLQTHTHTLPPTSLSLSLLLSSSSSLCLSLYHFPPSLPPPTPSLGCKRTDSSMCLRPCAGFQWL